MESSILLFQVRNTPPHERSNWDSLNEGQQQYAYEQWMQSRVRAGEQFTPPHVSDNEADGSRGSSQAEADRETAQTSRHTTPGPPTHQEQSLESPRRLDTEGSDTVADTGNINMETQNVPPEIGGNINGKRPAPNAPDGGAKRGKMGSSTKKAVGTAKPQGLEGTGERSVIYIDRPMNSKTVVIKVFKKQHKFLTFGIASKIIQNDIPEQPGLPAHNNYYCTTALAEIPVHKPVLYMNPSEFNLLPLGAEVLEVKVSVVQRNPLLSFFTNASTTQLATLNQNKNGVYAIGLNKTGYGTDRWYYAFNSTEPMIPEKVWTPVYKAGVPPTYPVAYQGLDNDFYGEDNTGTNFNSVVPKHQLGMYTVLKNYFCMTQNNNYRGGWPNLQSKVVEYDASAMTGELVVSYSYKPDMGLLKPPQKYLPTQLPYGPNDYLHGTLQSQFEAASNSTLNPPATDNITYTHNDRTRYIPNLDLYTDIEKSQYLIRGIGGNNAPCMQPSLHVGLNPVPALTTSALVSGDTNSSFTDTRIYFDVHCEMVVGYRDYTDRPHATAFNCAAGEQIFSAKSVDDGLLPIDTDSTPYCQLYGNRAIPTVGP